MADGRLGFVVDIQTNTEEAQDSITAFEQKLKGLSNSVKNGGIGKTFADKMAIVEQAFYELDDACDMAHSALDNLDKKLKDPTATQEDRQRTLALVDVYESLLDKIEGTSAELTTYQETLNKSANNTDTARTRMREMREELIRMREAGQTNTQAYRDLAQQLASLTDIQADVNNEAKKLASDQGVIQGLMGGVNGVAAAFTAAQGAVGLFSGESEQLQKIMLKVQSVMAITMGLSQLENALNKDNAFRQNIINKLKQNYTAILEKQAAAQTAVNATTSTGIALLTKMKAAIMSVPLVGWIIAAAAAIAGITTAIVKANDKGKKALELQNELNKATSDNINLLEQRLKLQQSSTNADIDNMERELALLKAQNAPLKEQQELEKKILENRKTMAHQAYKDVLWNFGDAADIEKRIREQQSLMASLSNTDDKRYWYQGKKYKTEDLKKTVGETLEVLNSQLDMIRSTEKEYRNAENALQVFEATVAAKKKQETEERVKSAIQARKEQVEQEIAEMNRLNAEVKAQMDEQEKAEADALNNVLTANKSYYDELLELEKQYQNEREILEGSDVEESVKIRTRLQLERNYTNEKINLLKKEVNAVKSAVEQQYESRVTAANMINDEELRNTELKKIDIEITEQLVAIFKSFVNMGMTEFVPTLQEMTIRLENYKKTTDKTTESTEVLNKKLSDNIRKIGSSFGEITGILTKFTTAMGDAGVVSEDTAEMINDVADAMSDAFAGASTGAQVGGVVGAIVGGVIGLGTGILNIVGKARQAQQEAMEAYRELIKEVQTLREELEKMDIFGSRSGGWTQAVSALATASEKYQAMLQEYSKLSMHNDIRDNYDLLELFPELYKEMVEAMQTAQEGISQLFGSIGDDILNVLSDTTKSWDDALDDFTSNLSGYVRRWVAEMLYVNHIKDTLSGLEDDVKGAAERAKLTGDMSILVDAIRNSLTALSGMMPEWKAIYDQVGQIVGDFGFGGGSTSATSNAMSGAVSGMSAETSTLIAGQLTAMRLNAASIDSTMRQTLIHVAGIHEDTERILERFESAMNVVAYNQSINAY